MQEKNEEEILGARTPLPGGFNADGALKSPVIKQAPVIGTELLTNPGFETWEDGLTPAYLTSGTGLETNPETWASIMGAGSYKISIDGTLYVITPDFTSVLTMQDVADANQLAIRTATSGLETCIFDGTKLIISSALQTSSSSISVASSPDLGVDISGTSGPWLAMDSVLGVVTNYAPSAPTGYTVIDAGEAGLTGTFEKETTKVHTGANAFKVTGGSDGSKAPLQFKTGLTQGSQVLVDMWARVETLGAGAVGCLVIPLVPGEEGFKVWDKATQAFVVVADDPSPYIILVNSSTETYSHNPTVVTVNEDEQIAILPIFMGSEGQIGYFDDFSIKSYTAPATKDLFIFKNDSELSNLTMDDIVAAFGVKDGAAYKKVLGVLTDGTDAYLGSELADINFINQIYQMDENTDGKYKVLNTSNAYSILGESSSVDLKNTGVTVLYTVPLGYTAYIQKFDADLAFDTYSVGFAGSIGNNTPDWSNYNTYSSVGTLFSTGQISFSAGGGVGNFGALYKAAGGSVIKINITTGATATTLEGKFRAIGYLVKN